MLPNSSPARTFLVAFRACHRNAGMMVAATDGYSETSGRRGLVLIQNVYHKRILSAGNKASPAVIKMYFLMVVIIL